MTAATRTPPPLAAVIALVDACTAVDGVAPFSGHILSGLGGGELRFLPYWSGDRLLGLAVLPMTDPAELAVHPESRRQGIGGALLDRTVDEVGRVWAHGALPAAARLAASRDLTVVRELVQLRRSIDPADGALDPVRLPAGVTIRTFRPGADDDAFLGVNARAFSWHPEQGRLDQSGLDAELAEPWFDPAGFFLAVDGQDRVLGFHWTKVHTSDPTPGAADPVAIGEIYVLGVDPESPVRGLGTPLSLAGLAYLRDRGLRTVMLYSEGDNVPALRLYERLGFRRHLTDLVYGR